MRQTKSTRLRLEQQATRGRLVRVGTFLVGVTTLVMGLWSFFAPESFFDGFPTSAADWVSALGVYNEHLMRDFGSAQVGLGVAAIAVAASRSEAGIRAVLLGYVVFGSLHLAYHFGTFGVFSTASAAAQAVALATFVVVPTALLFALHSIKRKEIST